MQAASQANALEMPNDNVTVDDGLGAYLDDKTQGPAVVITTLPSLYHRITNFGDFNALENLGVKAGEGDGSAPVVKNGYVQVGSSWGEIARLLTRHYDDIKVMTLSDAPVTGSRRIVNNMAFYDRISVPSNTSDVLTSNQVFSWAIPSNCYGNMSMEQGGPLAYEAQYMAIKAAYESAVLFSELRRQETGVTRQKLALTMVGGGAFQVKREFVLNVMDYVLQKYCTFNLDVTLIMFDENPVYVLGKTYDLAHGDGHGGGDEHQIGSRRRRMW